MKLIKTTIFVACLIILILTLGTLQYYWLGIVSKTESKSIANMLGRSSHNFVSEVNTDFFLLYKYYSFGKNDDRTTLDVKKYIALKRKREPGNFFNNLTRGASIVTYQEKQGFSPDYVIISGTGPQSKLPPEIIFENLISLYKKNKIELLYTLSLHNSCYMIIPYPILQNSKEAPVSITAVVITLNRKYLLHRYFPGKFNKFFLLDEKESDYQLTITDTLYNNTLFYSSTKTTASPQKKAFIDVPLIHVIPRYQLDKKEMHNFFKSKKHLKQREHVGKPRNYKGPPRFLFLPDEFRKGRMSHQMQAISEMLSVINLQVSHKAGPLNRIIKRNRFRNLAVSFGILILLTTSIIILFTLYSKLNSIRIREMQFIASITHELRTPLAVITSAGQNLSDGIIKNEDKVIHYGILINKEVKRLSKMIEKILLYSGVTSGIRKTKKESINFNIIVDSILESYSHQIIKNEIFISKNIIEPAIVFKANPHEITIILQNLISNALKYGNDGKYLGIEINSVNNNRKPAICIRIRDKGNGIKTTDLPLIFEPFYRTQTTINKQIPGSGLGLTLINKIIKTNKGTIHTKSNINKGTIFTINLPYP